jgi:hypothetical protein
VLDEILRTTQGDILIELNYTCGKKIMSSVVYDVIKNKKFKNTGRNIEINLTYIDAERELMYVEQLDKRKVSSIKLCDLEESFELSVIDIIETYNTEICEFIEAPKYEKLSNKIGGVFESISNKEKGRKDYDDLMKARKRITKEKKNEKIFMDELNATLKDFKLSEEDINSAGFKNEKEIKEYFEGSKWFEEYILNKLLPLKEEKIIDGLVANIKRKQVLNEREFEVDIVLYKRYKMYALSLSATNSLNTATEKLYEIFQRSTDLAGDETEKGLITLLWDGELKELKAKCMNLWDDDLPSGVFISGVKDLPCLKDKVKNWICGGGINVQ